ncbi:RNA polymerase II mediator complex subunit [Xylographa opegraphella]|nr:RNA polymerase II mediator complex subunit [Xylographa opegraphella]
MTTHYDARNSKPPARTNSAGTVGQLSGVPAQTLSLPPNSVPLQTITSSISTNSTLYDTIGPAPKRQKTHGGYASITGLVNSYIVLEKSSNLFPSKTLSEVGVIARPTQTESTRTISTTTSVLIPSSPTRPHLKPLRKPGVARLSLSKSVNEEVQTKPYALEVPKIAPQYENHTSTDFFPWLGTHQEDILGEISTKNGFYDRTLATPQEYNSGARSIIWTNLKHKSGLQILSSLFVSVLDRRQKGGIVTAKCTFKPPPRVTLTDAKRESWLRDLASSTIPLRRLSRTIPHGIRGKSLLDHCLAKKIPVSRAVWLAKCVGANEIRAFKRKGTSGAFATGGESKWIREWTANVEQFVEVIVRSCGSPEWQLDLTYGLQLVKHIYSEHLLNKQHFLDWILTSFQDSDFSLLPSWFLVLQGYFDDITCQIPLGRRLVKALLERLHKISNVDIGNISDSISKKLFTALRSLILSYPSYILVPDSWAKYEPILKACTPRSDTRWASRIKQIETRNFRLIEKSAEALRDSGTTSRKRFIDLLDTSQVASDISILSMKSLDTLENRALLIYTLLEWSTTPYRTGLQRTYVALRLLRLWNDEGLDLDRSVLQFLGKASTAAAVDRKAIYRLISEMIRTGLFSISKYLQWLIAGGSRIEHAVSVSADAFELELLNNIPLCDLPLHVLNLRTILITINSVSCSNNYDNEEAVKQNLGTHISVLKTSCIQHQEGDLTTALANLSGTTKYSISRWIRDRVGDECSCTKGAGSGKTDDDLSRASISLADFYAVRHVLETLEDFPMLAEVLILLCASDKKPLLEAIAETVNQHVEVFRAIGAAEDLFLRLVSRTKGIYTRDQSNKSILSSLVDIGENFPNRGATVLKLMQEIGFCDPKTAIVARSPISDTMADAVQSGDSNFLEELETMLSGGVCLDKPILHGIFTTISERVRTAWFDDDPIKCRYISLLSQLRSIDNHETSIQYKPRLAQFGTQDVGPFVVFNASINQEIRTLLRFANDFNIRLCQLKLKIMLNVPQDHVHDSDTFREECTTVLVEEATSTFKSRPEIWLSFLSSLPQPNAEMFYARCTLKLLATMPECALETSTPKYTPHLSVVNIDALLASIAALEDRLSSMPSIDSIAMMSMKISQVHSYIQARDRGLGSQHEGESHINRVRRRVEQDNVLRGIHVLLRLLTIHQSVIRNIGFPQETLCKFLLSLSLLATTSKLKANRLLSNTVLDAIALFSDLLCPESWSYCTAVLADQQHLHDYPLRKIFTSANDESDWLHVTGLCKMSTVLAETITPVPFPIRRWEMVQDATPMIGENDTSLSLTLFGAKKAVL